ncbi:MAG TPA: hypothetical protein VJ927_05060 [Actinomycetota bacterium]|nr:hypothetical protein [Actinomycetota bacterium]
MSHAPAFKLFGGVLKWSGLATVATGALGSAYAVMTAVQTRTGWGLSALERCCMRGDLNKAALALLLGSMFFVVAGSGMILIARPLLGARPPSRWPRWLARSLYVYSACSVALAIILMRELGEHTVRGASLAGLVSYCLLVAVGLLIASWGLRRFAETSG